jgi:hypothetical protein
MKVLSGITNTAFAFLALTSFSSAQTARREARLVEFDAPGATTVWPQACDPYCGTAAVANNDLGEIVGSYTDGNIVPHGFLRSPNGEITSFDAPGAGLGNGLDQGTVAYAINDLGEIAGQFQDSSYVFHGFVRYPNGSFATFDEPDAGTEVNQPLNPVNPYPGTLALDINLRGATAGYYVDKSNAAHGFVRSPANQFTSFDPTGSVNTYVCGATCLSLDGAVVGYYWDSKLYQGFNVIHGFVRQANGTITSFDAPEPTTPTPFFTIATSINPKGEITGYSADSNFVVHGFVRHADGSFTTFNDPEAGTGTPEPYAQGTSSLSINLVGTTTGQYRDASDNGHGFERFPDGQFANFDAPDAALGSRFATLPQTNNAEGEVAGLYTDANNLDHGFLWIPGIPDRYAVNPRAPGQSEGVSSAMENRALIGGLGAPGSQPQ